MSPHRGTDWREVAVFLIGVLLDEHPDYQPFILQLIQEHTHPVSPQQKPINHWNGVPH